MPELPEAETIRRGLEAEVVGRRLEYLEATGARSTRRHPRPGVLGERLVGRELRAVSRLGKVLLLDWGDEVAVVHLGMSGQLLWAPAPSPARPRHSHVVFGFGPGAELRFVDPRTFGQIYLSSGSTTRTRPDGREWAARRPRPLELAHLGPDPLVDRPERARFVAALLGRRTMMKALLMDQRFVAGLGNIYSDEILHASGVRYDRPAASLDEDRAGAVFDHMGRILRASVRLGGSSLADMQYRDLYGRPGRYQNRHRVFAREGRPCPTCGTPIRRQAWGGRSTFYCPTCQL